MDGTLYIAHDLYGRTEQPSYIYTDQISSDAFYDKAKQGQARPKTSEILTYNFVPKSAKTWQVTELFNLVPNYINKGHFSSKF